VAVTLIRTLGYERRWGMQQEPTFSSSRKHTLRRRPRSRGTKDGVIKCGQSSGAGSAENVMSERRSLASHRTMEERATPSHPGVLGPIPKREEPGKQGHPVLGPAVINTPCVKVPGSSPSFCLCGERTGSVFFLLIPHVEGTSHLSLSPSLCYQDLANSASCF
jgi:hypothetical protein